MNAPNIAASGELDVAVIGAGAAGIAAGRRLSQAPVDFAIIEARSRLGGRAWTVPVEGHPQDLGCGWLHSGDINPWTKIVEAQGFTVDRRPAPWAADKRDPSLTEEEQADFRRATRGFYARISEASNGATDRPASDFLEPGNRWNELLNAVSTYTNGAELDTVSVHDVSQYADDEVNWRVLEGYGSAIAHHGAGLAVVLDCQARRIDHRTIPIRIETSRGEIQARTVIVTVPTDLLAMESIQFVPPLPDKIQAATDLPLGFADKVLLSIDVPEEVPSESRLFGRIDRTATGAYHLRPFGRPLIEGYFGGQLALDLDREGDDAFAAFAIEELIVHFGGGIRRRLRRAGGHRWCSDPFARGAYSHALPGKAGARAVLAGPVNGKLFFAGEACSTRSYSTAHGAYEAGLAAAEAVLTTLAKGGPNVAE